MTAPSASHEPIPTYPVPPHGVVARRRHGTVVRGNSTRGGEAGDARLKGPDGPHLTLLPYPTRYRRQTGLNRVKRS